MPHVVPLLALKPPVWQYVIRELAKKLLV